MENHISYAEEFRSLRTRRGKKPDRPSNRESAKLLALIIAYLEPGPQWTHQVKPPHGAITCSPKRLWELVTKEV